jgi:hypothetical protein
MVRPIPDRDPPDLMLPLSLLSDAAGRDLILSGEDVDAVRAYCSTMGARFGSSSYVRFLFGLPIDEALQNGYLITQRGLRETTPHACAEETARVSMELVTSLEHSTENRHVLDIFAGVGQIAYSYALAGYVVDAYDNDWTTVRAGRHNMKRAGLPQVRYECADGPTALAHAILAGEHFSVLHLDPPWRGNYQYNLTRPFHLSSLGIDTREVVAMGLRVSDLVVLNLPHTILSSEIQALGSDLRCSTLLQFQHIKGLADCFALAPTFFYFDHRDRDVGVGHQERHQTLTLGGQRVSP